MSTLPARARCVVVGMGAFGSATAYRLARRIGDEVVVLEQFAPGHTRGASEDHSRIIRHAYESPIYTRLTRAMFAAWEEVERESGMSLVTVTGGLDIGDPAVPGSLCLIDSVAAAMADQEIPFDELDPDALRARWPQWRLPEEARILFQPEAGSLDIARACASHLALAAGHGARLHPQTHTQTLEPASDGGSVRVHTSEGTIEADDVVVCAGKWTKRILRGVADLRLTFTREQVTYFVPPVLADFSPCRFPVWIRQGEPCFYGIGTVGVPAVKAAEDLGGPEVEVDDLESPTDPQREERVRTFLRQHLPEAAGPVLRSRACVYDLTSDRDFLLGPVPAHPRLHVVIGAGHGAKFAALFGLVLSELVLDGQTTLPVAPFSLDRPGVLG